MLYPLPTHSLRSFVEKGGLAPTVQLNSAIFRFLSDCLDLGCTVETFLHRTCEQGSL